MDSIVVTGAQGFLGAAIGRYFREQGREVLGLSRRQSNSQDASWRATNYSLEDLIDLFSKQKPFAVVHAAGGASVAASVADPRADFAAGPALTGTLLEALKLASPATKFIFLSSAAVYGNPHALPVSEEAPRRPVSPYGRHKMACEDLCAEYGQSQAVPCAVARIFSAYGPGLRKQVLWDLCVKLSRSKESLALQGTGAESRDFIHSRDVALALDLILTHGATDGSPYNLAVGAETTIRSLAEDLCRLIGVSPALEFDGHVPEGNPLRWQADMSRLEQLGFAPTISLAEGLREYTAWFGQNLPQ